MQSSMEGHSTTTSRERSAAKHVRMSGQTVADVFEAWVARAPHSVALESEDVVLTYEQLDQRANALAARLAERGVKQGSIVAIRFDPCLDVVVSIVALHKLGAAYLPIGAECPDHRVVRILEVSGAVAVLTSRHFPVNAKFTIPVVHPAEEDLGAAGARAPSYPARAAHDLAYVIYTSGTTGEPKGVMIEHASLLNYLSWAADTYLSEGTEVFPFYTSISFDMTVTSILLPLVTGNRLITYRASGNELALDKVLQDNRATLLKLTPSHMRLIKDRDLSYSKITRLVAGGEELGASLAEDVHAAFGGCVTIYNEYGPTEATVGCMIYRYQGEPIEGGSVPIGEAIANTTIHVLDESLQPVAAGQIGEVFIGGAGLARGYLHRPDLTAALFVDDPQRPGHKLYRTGDLAAQNRDGAIVYKGRRDNQVKVRGFRIEVDEVEQAIIDFQKRAHKRSVERLAAPLAIDIRTVPRCNICINRLDESSPEEMTSGVCKTCVEYDAYKEHAKAYFRQPQDLFDLIKKHPSFGKSKYDAVLAFSGGKDSTYVLHRLAEQGIRVLAFTFDNGYISKVAFDNMRHTCDMLGVDLLVGDAKEINSIFVDSLLTESNVCNGCFKSINTLSLRLAHKHGAKFVINGLSRGQIFDINVHGLFKLGVFDDAAIEARLQSYRKLYFSSTNRVSRLLDAGITETIIDDTIFVDYFRYDDVVTRDVVKYISEGQRAWVRPSDTGSSSSNCRLNDASIYFHVKNKGDHFYTSQLSWDVRLGTITREEAFAEISEFDLAEKSAQNVLHHIGFFKPKTGACVVGEKAESFDGTELKAYVVADALTDFSELRAHLASVLPEYMVPARFYAVDHLPLASSGKVDRKALASAVVEANPVRTVEVEAAKLSPVEQQVVAIWSRVLALTPENIPLDADFFELGGHSFRYVKMMSEIKAKLGVALNMDLTQRTTVSSIVSQLERARR